ncbi:MAG: ribonuclease R [Clostridia bacterium]|nr:ribonuclease R [Clostridia bacterium]
MKREIIEGKLQGNERGYAFLIPLEDGKEDYFIPHSDLKGAMHGDTVLAETTDGDGARTTARVLKILKRGITELVGTYFTCKSGGFVSPDERKYYNDIFIPFGKGVRAKAGDKVVCKILSYPKKQNPEGIITEVLGRQFERKAELKSILRSFNLPDKFPKEVLSEANALNETVTEKDLENRKDFRGLTTFTIDGEDARDFDDAVSIKQLRGGKYLLGVHIADVSHYVKGGGAIDKEAFTRATSVYFPERVIPMLPETLCNDVCSLKEGVERLTLSCVMTVNKEGKVVDYEITPAVIKSTARLTYNKVQKIIDGDKTLINEYKSIVKDILLMNELADILIERRDLDGSIDLDVKESAIYVDNQGEIVVKPAPRDKAHRIIEEFMILANVTVAEYMFYLEKPFIYRVHEDPTEEKLENFYAFLAGLGINAKRKRDEIFSKDFQSILKNAEGTPAYTLINRVMLRSMQKAKYSPIDTGHFGLSLDHYCHFTSPIRRYPDLVIHRIIKDLLSGKNNLEERYGEFVFDAAKQSSEMEKNATEAERAVDEYYKLLYISDFIGEEFDGVISGVMNFGIFVELDSGVEGLVKSETISSRKRLTHDEKNYTLSDGKTTFRLGQKVKIKVVGVNLGDRRAEFMLVDKLCCENKKIVAKRRKM